jgi:hypothetical protein
MRIHGKGWMVTVEKEGEDEEKSSLNNRRQQ